MGTLLCIFCPFCPFIFCAIFCTCCLIYFCFKLVLCPIFWLNNFFSFLPSFAWQILANHAFSVDIPGKNSNVQPCPGFNFALFSLQKIGQLNLWCSQPDGVYFEIYGKLSLPVIKLILKAWNAIIYVPGYLFKIS